MLSASASRVTEAALKMRRSWELIKYRAGHIHVLNRLTLEKLRYECYSVVRNETGRLSLGILGRWRAPSGRSGQQCGCAWMVRRFAVLAA